MGDATTTGTIPPLRVALLSRWHVHAEDYAREARELSGIEIVRIWDEDVARGRTWGAELGVPFEPALELVLGDDAVDAVIVTTPTRMHRDVLGAAAEARKHIFSEKVLGATTADVDAILAAVDDAKVRMMLSLPLLTSGAYLAAQQALDRGDLGRLVSVRARVSHDGAVRRDAHDGTPNPGGHGWLPERFFDAEAASGGALIDLGAHPIYLCNRLAGRPVGVSAMFGDTTGHGVDDTAAVLVRYVDGALGVVETGFANAGCPTLLELHGTEGTFLAESDRVRVRRGGDAWQERVAPAPLASAMRQWLAQIRDGTPPGITRRDMRDLTRVAEAAYRSARSGEHAQIP